MEVILTELTGGDVRAGRAAWLKVAILTVGLEPVDYLADFLCSFTRAYQ